MNKIQQLFKEKKDVLSIYYSAGFPALEDTTTVLQQLEESGADLVEIGIPFSDPLADGPTIQKSGQQALQNGMSVKKLFEQLKDIRSKVSIPIILMGYLNPVYRYGIKEFAAKCKEVGVDGVILPDLPFQEYMDNYKVTFDENDVSNIFLVTPQTPDERIRMIDQKTNSFIYLVSSAGVTGAKKGLSQEQITYFKRIKDLNLNSPALIGFGISDKASFDETCKYADGAIIGSAFVKMLGESKDLKGDIDNFISSIKG